MGTRSGRGYSFITQGDGGQPGVAFGESTRDPCLRRRQRNHDRQLSEAATTDSGRENNDRKSVEGAERSAGEKAVQCAALDQQSAVGAGERTTRIVADGEHRRS